MAPSDDLYQLDVKRYRRQYLEMTGEQCNSVSEADEPVFVNILPDDAAVPGLDYCLIINYATDRVIGRCPSRYLTLVPPQLEPWAKKFIEQQKRIAELKAENELLRRNAALEYILQRPVEYRGNEWMQAYHTSQRIVEQVQAIVYEYDAALEKQLDIRAFVFDNFNWIITGKREGT